VLLIPVLYPLEAPSWMTAFPAYSGNARPSSFVRRIQDDPDRWQGLINMARGSSGEVRDGSQKIRRGV
jgi:hypothetical protein